MPDERLFLWIDSNDFTTKQNVPFLAEAAERMGYAVPIDPRYRHVRSKLAQAAALIGDALEEWEAVYKVCGNG